MCSNSKEEYAVFGPHGGISISLLKPESKETCPLVILMHGFAAVKDMYPMPLLANELAKAGIASIRFDFDAHGKSEGRSIDMTISSEVADAKAVFEYACSLPFVTNIAFLGHSQGGVIAGMLAGQLERSERKPKCIVLLTPASSIKDDIIQGHYLNARFNPDNLPDYIEVLFQKIGKCFLSEVKELPIFEISSQYSGEVFLIFGDKDIIVPAYVIDQYRQCYPKSICTKLFCEGHQLNRNPKQLIDAVIPFLKSNLLR